MAKSLPSLENAIDLTWPLTVAHFKVLPVDTEVIFADPLIRLPSLEPVAINFPSGENLTEYILNLCLIVNIIWPVIILMTSEIPSTDPMAISLPSGENVDVNIDLEYLKDNFGLQLLMWFASLDYTRLLLQPKILFGQKNLKRSKNLTSVLHFLYESVFKH